MSYEGFEALSSVNEDLLTPCSHYGPVTALKVHSQYVLAGYGCILKLFKINTISNQTSLIFTQQVFKKNKIHHITVSPEGSKVVVSGGRSFAVLDLKQLTSNSSVSVTEKAINEWITTSEFLNENLLLILNSHNTIYQIDVSQLSTTQNFVLVEKVDCNEKSILYSGSIRVLADHRVLVAAGTVMSGVLIWDMNSRQILHNLTEHEGSIFGVKIDKTGRYIVSCSDDRSIKLYNFENGALLATGWGHGSRIWTLEFFHDQSNGIKLMSGGEDCTVRIWKYLDGQEILTQEELWENAHRGKHVWSGDLDDISLQICVTGGADGRIRLHDILGRSTREEYRLDYIFETSGLKLQKNEIIKQYFLLSQLNSLIILTSHGSLILFNEVLKLFSKIQLDAEETARFTNFGVMKGFDNINTVVLCTRNGSFLILEFSSTDVQPNKYWVEDEHLQGNKVTNFMAQADEESNKYYLFLDSPNPKIPFILKEFTTIDNRFTYVSTKLLNQPQQASFTTTDMVIDMKNKWLVLGSRYVTVAVYDLDSDEETLELQLIEKKLSAGDTITSVSIIESKRNEISVLLTVRDGVYMFAKILKDEAGELSLNVHHHNKISRGFIEGGCLVANDLILYGFKSSYFYVWNESKQIEITNELCGGSHRQWELFKNDSDFKFIYINKSSLYIKHYKSRFTEARGLLNDGTHGREIRDVSICTETLADNSRLIMSASEDTTVRLSKLHANGEIENFWSLNNHVSGLQRVKFMSRNFVGSSAANEEFYIWKLDTFNDNVPISVEYARLKPSSDNPDLRVMDFDSFPYKNGFIIATVYSDSNIKILYFDIPTKKFDLLLNDFYTTCCILNVHFLTVGTSTYLQIGATDGHLTIWDVTSILRNISEKPNKFEKAIIKQQLHQNGIKGLLLTPKKNGYRIITGGDDNALVYSQLSQSEDGQLSLEVKDFVEGAASSTITSISAASGETFIVTSVDQIIRKWNLVNEKLTVESARYTTIADTGCSDSTVVNGESIIVIGGAGLSSWKC